jgi:RecB family endonuclease NucS
VATYAEPNLRERQDMQRVLRDHIDAISPDLMVLAEEYGEWEDSKRRIDLLCIDRDSQLVVVELKRSDDGGHMELQALRYAAMVSTMRFEQAVTAHRQYLPKGRSRWLGRYAYFLYPQISPRR